MKPEGHKLLIKPDKTEEVSKGGIVFADTTKDRENRAKTIGTFMAAGPRVDLAFCGDKEDEIITAADLIPGKTRLFFNMYPGVDYRDDETDEIFWVMNDEDIHGLI